MKRNDIHPPLRKWRMPMTTDGRQSFAIGSNLLSRNFKTTMPDIVWPAEISYIPTGEGWLYLAAVKCLANMEIVGLLSAIAGNRLPGTGWPSATEDLRRG